MSSLFERRLFRTGLSAHNGIVLAPLTNMQSNADGSLGDDERRWLLSRAAAGDGIVMTCAAHVARDVTFKDLVEKTLGAGTLPRTDLHIGQSRDGELFITSREDGVIRMLVP